MVLIFVGTNFRGFRTKSRKFVPTKCLDLSKLRKLIPAKFFFKKLDLNQQTVKFRTMMETNLMYLICNIFSNSF